MNREEKISIKLAYDLRGDREVRTEAGRIDILTRTELIEIKTGKQWKSAIGQLIAYGESFPNHKLVLYLFDYDDINIALIRKTCRGAKIYLRLFEDSKELDMWNEAKLKAMKRTNNITVKVNADGSREKVAKKKKTKSTAEIVEVTYKVID